MKWLELICAERFGNLWNLEFSDQGMVLSLDGEKGCIVFDSLVLGFSENRSDSPCTLWDAKAEGWVPILGSPLPSPGVNSLELPLIEKRNNEHVIHYDILGLTYWMFARIEEIERTDLDRHGRFAANLSNAYLHNYLERPVVDEWLDILRQVILQQWPEIKIKNHRFEIELSHDVDRPFRYLYVSRANIVRQVFGDFVKRRNISVGFKRYITWNAVRSGELRLDPFNTFDWIMDQLERFSISSTFNFICGRTENVLDADYDLENLEIRKLLKNIHSRGHKIGLHPSYNAYQKQDTVNQEFKLLKRICMSEEIEQEEWGGRMHYLRWKQPLTMCILNDAGLNYDASLGYADHAGFRCGTCHEYTMFDAVNGEIMSLKQRPLVVMDSSIFDHNYMNLELGQEAVEYCRQLALNCRKVGGKFTLLWHNSSLETCIQRNIFEAMLN